MLVDEGEEEEEGRGNASWMGRLQEREERSAGARSNRTAATVPYVRIEDTNVIQIQYKKNKDHHKKDHHTFIKEF